MLVSIADIRAARKALPPQVRRTPMLPCEELSRECGLTAFLKCENLQVTGSYKARAAFTILNRLPQEQKARGAALTSSGNFAAAFAYMGTLLGIPTAVVMMRKSEPFKVERTHRYGAEVIFCDDRFDARFEVLEQLQRERGMVAINHFEDANVIIGHGTLGLEMLDDLPDMDAVLVPVSSGGLIAGVATAIKESQPHVRVIGVQPEGSNAAYLSFRVGHVQRIASVRTICDALVAQYPGQLPFQHIQRYVDDMVLVSDEDVKMAV
ncbi:MAG TPA: pyridoxal-phosphate dependent enzyme, partial [Armatimonadetes bacterium]|nr:pyridoxal-phosphate dependent enzyme [Armatimonadota bacterium]